MRPLFVVAAFVCLTLLCLVTPGYAFSSPANPRVHCASTKPSPFFGLSRSSRNHRRISLSAEVPSDEASDERNEKGNISLKKRVSAYFRGSEKDDGLTFRQRLGKMGLATVLSYGWISNTNAMALVAAAWYVFSVKVRIFLR